MTTETSTYWSLGLDYTAYVAQGQALLAEGKTSPTDTEGKEQMLQYTRLNMQRMQRWDKTFVLLPEWQTRWASMPRQRWLVITEVWCGDAAQNVPLLAQIAQASQGKIEMRTIWRDSHLELMDQYLTNGGRSIPKLIILNEQDEVLATWGPRPAAAQALVMAYKQDPQGKSFDQFAEELHRWYFQDKGVSMQTELLELLASL